MEPDSLRVLLDFLLVTLPYSQCPVSIWFIVSSTSERSYSPPSFGRFSWGFSKGWSQCSLTYLKKPQMDSRENRVNVFTPGVAFCAGKQKCSKSTVWRTWVALPALSPETLLCTPCTQYFVPELSKGNLEWVMQRAFFSAASRLLQEVPLLTSYIHIQRQDK